MLSDRSGQDVAPGEVITLPNNWPAPCGAQGTSLRGAGESGTYIISGEAKQLVESSHTEVREERSFTILEDVNCPAVLAEQCFVTSEADVAQFGSEDGCRRTARAYYEAICAYFETTPLPE